MRVSGEFIPDKPDAAVQMVLAAEAAGRSLHFTLHVRSDRGTGAPRFLMFVDDEPTNHVLLAGSMKVGSKSK